MHMDRQERKALADDLYRAGESLLGALEAQFDSMDRTLDEKDAELQQARARTAALAACLRGVQQGMQDLAENMDGALTERG